MKVIMLLLIMYLCIFLIHLTIGQEDKICIFVFICILYGFLSKFLFVFSFLFQLYSHLYFDLYCHLH